VRRRDEAEFELFARARSQELMRAALALTGNAASAEDLVQATLTRAYTRWGRIRSAGNPVAYVRTMQTRLFLDERRRRSSHEIPLSQLPEGAAPEPDVALRHALLTALAGLEPMDRAVVVHRYLLDSDVASVAAELRLTPQAVRSRASRALSKVRAELGAEVSGGAGTSGKDAS
jgi:RNA polymerase sigma-70 factor (sigma-E family)